jgi:hypothetical protein
MENPRKYGSAPFNTAVVHGGPGAGGEMAPGLAGAEFASNWNDLSIGDLFERIKTSMPQNNPGSLSRPQVADIVAFILGRNNFPAGQTELPSAADQLAQIKFAPKK